jgi:hypothetical protein
MLEEKINKLKNIIYNNDKGHLPLTYRVELMRDIKNVTTINKIFFECTKQVCKVLKNEISINHPIPLILSNIGDYLYNNKGNKSDFENIIEEYKNYFEEKDEIAGLIGLSALSICNSIAYNASSIIDIDEYKNQDDDSFDWDVWNSDFYASMAYSGGNPFLNEGNIEKRIEFWLLYLETVKKVFKSPDKPLLLLSHSNMPLNDYIQEINRTQTYQKESILEKINTVINNAIDSYQKDYDGVWEKIYIDARCMCVGLHIATYFTKDNESFKIKGNLNSFDLMDDVKCEMYEQAKHEGAWFFCKIEILPSLKYNISFNYDDKNKLLEERLKSPENFQDEFEEFPRSKEFTPDWWQTILGTKAKYLKK